MLLADETIADSVVVITGGELMAWGQRGAVSMPNDSVGKDMRGKWLVPGTAADLAAGDMPKMDSFQPGQAVQLLIFDRAPTSDWSDRGLVGSFIDATLQMPEASD